jgi:hypothetical protein
MPVVQEVHLIQAILVVQVEQVWQVQFQVHQSQEVAVVVGVVKLVAVDHLDLEGQVVEELQVETIVLVD